MNRVALPLALIAFLAAAPGLRAQTAPVGINVGQPSLGDTEAAWADAAYTFGAWSGTTGPLTPDGYPTAGPASCINQLRGYPDGVYTLTYRGSAAVAVSGMGSAAAPAPSATDPAVTVVPVTISHAAAGSVQLKVTNLDPASPFGDLHLWAPGCGPGQVFTPAFLKRMAPFALIRTMNWCGVNNNPVVNWADRVTPARWGKATQPRGLDYEVIAALGKATNKPLWVNVPWFASDDYIRQMADIFRDQSGGVPVTVELANELWNGAFQQYKWNAAAAQTNPALTHKDDAGRAAEGNAFLLKHAADLWRAEFGDQAGRLKFVITGQVGNVYYLRTALAWAQANNSMPDMVAVAPYAQLRPADDQEGLTPDQLFDLLNADVAGRLTVGVQANAALAAQYGIPLAAYEGGQSLVPQVVGPNAGVVNAANKALCQRDPRMAGVNAAIVALWRGASPSPFYYYDIAAPNGNFGAWGLLEFMSDPGSVKWDGLMRLCLPDGDLDYDGAVTVADALVVLGALDTAPAWRETGDADGDGDCDADDLVYVAKHLPPPPPRVKP